MEKKVKLPRSFAPLLWSYDFRTLDPENEKRPIIVNAINYGDLEHWRWLIRLYGKDGVRHVLEEIPVTELRPRVRRLATLMFGISKFRYAPRGAR